MHRTNADGNVKNKFDPGDPLTGRLPTQIDAAWLNDIQENIAAACEARAPLVEGDVTQLLDAIRSLGTAGVRVTRDGKVTALTASTEQTTYDGAVLELAAGKDAGRSGLRVTSGASGAQVELHGVVGGAYGEQWRANRSGSTGVSDERLKTLQGDIPQAQALAAVRAMRIVRFSWTDDGSEALGFLAGNVTNALASAGLSTEGVISRNAQGFAMVNRDSLLALLCAAVQELANTPKKRTPTT